MRFDDLTGPKVVAGLLWFAIVAATIGSWVAYGNGNRDLAVTLGLTVIPITGAGVVVSAYNLTMRLVALIRVVTGYADDPRESETHDGSLHAFRRPRR